MPTMLLTLPKKQDAMRKRLEAAGVAPKYDIASRYDHEDSLTLSEDEVKQRMDAGEDYVIRYKFERNERSAFMTRSEAGSYSIPTNWMIRSC